MLDENLNDSLMKFALSALIGLLWFKQVRVEFNNLMLEKLGYFKCGWNWIDVTYLSLTLFIIVVSYD